MIRNKKRIVNESLITYIKGHEFWAKYVFDFEVIN